MKCECGNETNAKDGVCAICAMDRHMNGTQPSIKKETTMVGITKQKECINCGTAYQPTSNVQKRCLPCGETRKLNKDRSYREAKKTAPKIKSNPTLPKNWGKVSFTHPVPTDILPGPVTKTVGANGVRLIPASQGNILSMLEDKREELAHELAAINTTILTLEKYAQ